MLSAETRIGPYEIVSLLGEGGMGEVYRARDTVLGREVADDGVGARWRRYFADRKLMAVEVNGVGGSFHAGVPKMLFETHMSTAFYWTNYADRRRFFDGSASRTGGCASDDGRVELDGRNQEVRSM